jgi:ABC-type sugar transport system substrate-binding protein
MRTWSGSWIRWRALGVITAAIAATIAVAACGGSSSSSSTGSGRGSTDASAQSSGTGSSCATKAQQFIAPYDQLPTKLPAGLTALPTKPPSGKLIIQVAGPIPSDQQTFIQMQAATKVIGWTAKKVDYDGTVPDLNAKLDQAIAEKPAVIALAGYPPAAIEQPLAKAKAAGIIVVLDSVASQPTSSTGFAAVSNGPVVGAKLGQILAYQFLADSGCHGSVAVFSVPYPIISLEAQQFASVVKASCPSCTVKNIVVQQTAIGTPAATNAAVAALQSSPSTKYAFMSIANLAAGVPQALNQAGITGVKIFGGVPDATAIAALRNGTNAFWLEESAQQNAWLTLDAALNTLETGKPARDNPAYPLNVLTTQNIKQTTGALPAYPLDYPQEFAKLWHSS